MTPTAKLALLAIVVAILALGQLLDGELRGGRLALSVPPARAPLLEPLPDAPLPRIPRTAIDGGPMPQEPKVYVVQAGETLGMIAQKTLGTQRGWKAILKLNEDVLKGPEFVRAGMKLKVPGPSWERWLARLNGETSPRTAAPAAGTSAPVAPSAPAAPAQAPPGPNEYVVAKGDTLGTIAQKTLGTSRAAGKILEANKDRLASADKLKVGMRLRIPKP